MKDVRVEVPCDSRKATQLGDWFHAFRFPDGVKVGRSSPRVKFPMLIEGIDLNGKSVIEAGCNAGGMTHLLESEGATVWPFDVLCENTGRWENQFNLIKEHLGINAEYNVLSVYDLKEKAQVVFMVGVYYHLEHPRLGIKSAWDAASECLVIEGAIMEDEKRPIAFFPTVDEPYNNDSTNFFIPSRSALKGMLSRLSGANRVIELKSQKGRAAFRVER